MERNKTGRELIESKTLAQIEAMAIVAEEFENKTGIEIVQMMGYVMNLRNDGHGESNKVVCARYSVNHRCVIAYLKKKNWIDGDKQLTEVGFREMNNAVGVENFNLREDTLVLQNYDGSLYWDVDNKHFETVWSLVFSNCDGRIYNEKLKGYDKPLSRQTEQLFEKIGINLEDYETPS